MAKLSFCKARRHKGRSRTVSLFILILGTRWEWVVNITRRPIYPRERAAVPIEYEASRTPGNVRKIWRKYS